MLLTTTKLLLPDMCSFSAFRAAIAQLGERQTEDLKVPGSIPGLGIFAGHKIFERSSRSDLESGLAARQCDRVAKVMD